MLLQISESTDVLCKIRQVSGKKYAHAYLYILYRNENKALYLAEGQIQSFLLCNNKINHLLCRWWKESLDISKNSCAMINVGLQNHK